MSATVVARRRNIQCKNKVKTGCATCRIRRVKCDENKPFCQKCLGTGRTCEGYESPFRLVFTGKATDNCSSGGSNSGAASLRIIQPTLTGIEIAPQDVELLGRYFSTKTMFDVKLGLNEEARQILQASLNDPLVRHAVSSLRALRQHLEACGTVALSVTGRTPSIAYDYGLQQYCMALGGLASKLSFPGPHGLKSALLCCQLFISIEQVRGNYAAMARHIIQGLSIMHEHRARPYLVDGKLMPGYHKQMPLLDVFIIKLFAAPCKFADPPAAVDISGTRTAVWLTPPHQQSAESRNLRTIAPDIRTGLTRIALTMLEFLDKVSICKSSTSALQLLSERASLMGLLELWLIDLELVLKDTRPQPEPLSVCFLRFFHQTLKTVLLGALEFSPDRDAELRTEIGRLHPIASTIDEGVKAYRTGSGVRSGRSKGTF
ncbi:hypothetical protein CGRA01v4_02005 [Colletotrichum graminicola]|uniref:Zn(2)-C6 fungal-type domain-containing protein n=1 Tax=Colletotrichum graminicola (strain M1.001 / M2 / FGSC 10212) TaxID=645133 RepID=E3QS58_COLGM|nr:uncharacterized protein GLRG_08625 [Colletotrichum graminicola M1.001]EFQ33696.1 hypothetical protein GLRG_08625 [Colletotrichum graminicola M1.001]WDK10726.1 hypothetical protein CGRA01v4_02005 [Colletotrichum graminicola]